MECDSSFHRSSIQHDVEWHEQEKLHVTIEAPGPVEAAAGDLFKPRDYVPYKQDLGPPVLVALVE